MCKCAMCKDLKEVAPLSNMFCNHNGRLAKMMDNKNDTCDDHRHRRVTLQIAPMSGELGDQNFCIVCWLACGLPCWAESPRCHVPSWAPSPRWQESVPSWAESPRWHRFLPCWADGQRWHRIVIFGWGPKIVKHALSQCLLIVFVQLKRLS